MKTVYALLVGIDAYREPVAPLRGCRNDIAQVATHLAARVATTHKLLTEVRCDEEATRAAVINGFRTHLRLAGPGDTALFWFCGHGSQAPVPAELVHTEPTGLMQTLVCVDSRRAGVPDLYDKELAILLRELAATGAHVLAVLDCCHADGATRAAAAVRRRYVPPAQQPPPVSALLAELLRSGAPEDQRGARPLHRSDCHVALAACRSDQAANEIPVDGEHRGVFSLALLHQLARLGPGATYRQLMTGARCYVENAVGQQVPVLHPVAGRTADQPFLGGRLGAPASTMTMRFVRGAWEIDAGSCHGVVAGSPDDPVRVGVPGTEPPQEAEVVRVHTTRSAVAPIMWTPDEDRQYPIVVTSVPLPAITVGIPAGGDEPTAARIAHALATAAPGGQPSPHVRAMPADDPDLLCDFRVETPEPGLVRVLSADSTPLMPDAAGVTTRERAAAVVRDLEHIARWRHIKKLDNPVSRLAGAVHIELLAAQPGEWPPPAQRQPLPTGKHGAVRLDYRHRATGWTAPEVFIRLRNTTDGELFCVLLDLTDRFRVHAELFPGATVAPRHTAWAADGGPVQLSLPPGREARPGASGRDWLKLIVAEEPFSSAVFELPRLGEPADTRRNGRVPGLAGVVERLGLTAVHRDIRVRPRAASDWTATILPVLTRVPATG